MIGSERSLAGRIKSLLWDISGAFGDIGILFPMAIVLIAQKGFNPTALFFMAGLFYLLSAYSFKITMPVQPLKAMSAIAIASGLSLEVINAAGIIMGVILLMISVTGLSLSLGKIFPLSVIRGIQLGLGLILVKTSSVFLYGDFVVGIIAAGFLIIAFSVMKKMPPLIPLLLIMIILAARELRLTSIGPLGLNLRFPDLDSLWTGFIILVLPQLGLTFGNAIVATEATAKMLYGRRAHRLNLKSLPLSMGLANVISGFFGGIPMCHGSGGITAHCKFGARDEKSGYIIGVTLIGLALLFGTSIFSIISLFPKGVLGALLFYVGIQHSLFIKDICRDKSAMSVALIVATLGFITNNLTMGFTVGIGIHYGQGAVKKVVEYFRKKYVFISYTPSDSPR